MAVFGLLITFDSYQAVQIRWLKLVKILDDKKHKMPKNFEKKCWR